VHNLLPLYPAITKSNSEASSGEYVANEGIKMLASLVIIHQMATWPIGLTTVAKAALVVNNMEYGSKYESFTLLGATKDGCKIF